MVYAKLDWFSGMFYNTSISEIMEKLGIYNELYDEMLSSLYERSQGFNSVAVFSLNGVSFEVRWDDYLSTEKTAIFERVFSKIRLDISGSGLDYLRSTGFKVDEVFTDRTFFGEYGTDYTVTRCDFAYDFVNYNPYFLDNLLNWIKQFESTLIGKNDDVRLYCGSSRAIQYSYRCGSHQKTLYLGSPRADKLVRIYDKYLEQTQNGVFIHGVPEAFQKNESDDIKSWFRIEFQSRRKCADNFLYSCDGDIRNVLRVIFEQYLIRDEKGIPLPCMVDLYDWEKLPPIIINSNFIQLGRVIDRSHDYICGQAYRSIVIYILRYGVGSFVDELNRCILQMHFSLTCTASRRYTSFMISLVKMLQEEKICFDDLCGAEKFSIPGIKNAFFLSGGKTSIYDLIKELNLTSV